jgi:hypothetical protein
MTIRYLCQSALGLNFCRRLRSQWTQTQASLSEADISDLKNERQRRRKPHLPMPRRGRGSSEGEKVGPIERQRRGPTQTPKRPQKIQTPPRTATASRLSTTIVIPKIYHDSRSQRKAPREWRGIVACVKGQSGNHDRPDSQYAIRPGSFWRGPILMTSAVEELQLGQVIPLRLFSKSDTNSPDRSGLSDQV